MSQASHSILPESDMDLWEIAHTYIWDTAMAA